MKHRVEVLEEKVMCSYNIVLRSRINGKMCDTEDLVHLHEINNILSFQAMSI